MLASLPKGHVAVYEDEVDIHLNPKIGFDWMVRGQQKEVVTPGRNQKRYLAGAMNAVNREVVWVEGSRKCSQLFIELLGKLSQEYAHAKVIHVILDNYRIHHSRITQMVVASSGGKIALHFLPPYCPDENKIERLWQDLHAEVTRNHRCGSMNELMQNVRRFLRRRAQRAKRWRQRHAA
jgi:transposase